MTSTYTNSQYEIIYSEGARKISLDEVYKLHSKEKISLDVAYKLHSKENIADDLKDEERDKLIEEIRLSQESFQDDLLFDALKLNE